MLESKDDGGYVGRVNIRLGPVALSFKGTAAIEDRDDEAMTARVNASGNEERARGTARATAEFAAEPANAGGTAVTIDTDLTLAGSIAQYARGTGIVESTAQLLIDDFAKNLETLLEDSEPAARARAATPVDTVASANPTARNADSDKPSSISVFALLWRLLQRWLFPSKAGGK